MASEAGAKVISLGERLRSHREEYGLSQAQAARELDVARTAYRLWEMEAAKPSPDRWRLIAGWLGVSISTMLLGEDLIDEDDAADADRIVGRAVRAGDERWDDLAAGSVGDFFEQERSTIERQALAGKITSAEAGRLTASLDRILANVHSRAELPASGSGEFRKELTADASAPQLARRALVVTAEGIPDAIVDRAELLTSELVTNSVERSDGRTLWLTITLRPDVLRVEVADAAPADETNMDMRARWSFVITAELASRWGGGREGAMNVGWFEIDLPSVP
jgi:transcriptional regulator with XRE-family HTH domain